LFSENCSVCAGKTKGGKGTWFGDPEFVHTVVNTFLAN
jgi:hypothetical protein